MDEQILEIENLFQQLNDNIVVLKKIGEEDIDYILFCSQMVLAANCDMVVVRNSIKILFELCDNPNMVEEKIWSAYWIIYYAVFTHSELSDCKKQLRKLYSDIFNMFNAKIEIRNNLLSDGSVNDEKTVVIVTSQFLGINHAPTRRVLDYAYTIQQGLGYKVIIINDGLMNLKNPTYFPDFSFSEVLNSFGSIDYKDTVFEFYQNPYKMPDFAIASELVNKIKNYKPVLVLSVGDSDFVADSCKSFAKTACIPCASSIPITEAEYPILCRDIRKPDDELLLNSNQKVISSLYTFIMPEENSLASYTKQDLLCSEDDWVIVAVGNRLDIEMTDDFMQMVDDILDFHKRIKFVVIGEVQKEHLLQNIRNREQIKFVGAKKDASQLIKYCNVCIQPHRSGGGRSAFEALYYGVPVVTPRFGDTWAACGEEFAVDNYIEMKEEIIKLFSNTEYYYFMQATARQRGLKLEDMHGMFRKLFEELSIS